jgi:D-alanyl-D-alanine carboxypeptidase
MQNSLEDEVVAILKMLDVPGSIVYLNSNVYESFVITYGYSDVKNKILVDVNDQFRIGSCTKMYVGIVLLQLCQEKLIDLDAPVSRYLLGLPQKYSRITVREIGNMTSGIPDYFEDPRFQQKYQNNYVRNWLPAELFAIGITSNQEVHQYSNTNTVILGLIIERVTKNSLEDEIKRRILEPLNLTETNFRTDSSFQKPCMNGYTIGQNNVTHRNVSWTWAAGNLTSDLANSIHFAKYAESLLNQNEIIQRKTWIPIGESGNFKLPLSYGFHLLKFDEFIGHNGSLPGYNTFILFEANTNTTLIVAINTDFNDKKIPPADILTEYIIAKLQNKAKFSDIKRIIENANRNL